MQLDYQEILDSMGTGMMIVDNRSRIVFFNREAERLTGWSREVALGRPCHEIFRSALCKKRCCFDGAASGDQRVMRFKTRIVTRTERVIPVDVRAMLVRDRSGRVIGRLESFLDDSARLALLARIKQTHTLDAFIGSDPRIRHLFDTLPVVAESDASILILGETGVGKDLLARAIHNISARRSGPFVKVNCAALPASLLESELFGYKRGAFTDAKRDKLGRFQMAEGGTIFLDEIGELPKDLQAKLLQVLDEQEFYPLGSTRPVTVSVRVIASTNRDLAAMTMDRSFRRDLYFRLKVVEVLLPPLRERRSDIPLLLDHFLLEWSTRMGKDAPSIDPGAMKVLLDYSYPGNVRELKNIVEHGLLLSQGGVIHRDDLPRYLLDEARLSQIAPSVVPPPASAASASSPISPAPQISADLFQAKEREALLEALTAHRWNLTATAQALRVARSTLWRKMKRQGLSGKLRPLP